MNDLKRTIVHRITGETVTFVETAKKTDGKYLLIEVSLPPLGDGPPLHIHDEFDEEFECIEGQLTITLGKEKLILSPTQKAFAAKLTPHTFSNNHAEPVTFRVKLTPPSRFEESIRIHYGLMEDELTDKKGNPKSLIHAALILSLQNTWISGIPISWQRRLFKYLVKRGHKRNRYASFSKYGVEI